jgi:predicted Zn-dependent protease
MIWSAVRYGALGLVSVLCYGCLQWLSPSSDRCPIVFVPIGQFQELVVQSLAQHYERTLGLRVTVRRAIPLEESAIDHNRRQLVGDELIDLMKRRLPVQEQEQAVMIVGLTTEDMYIRQKNWRFAFAMRQGGRFAVVSTARMDPANFGLAPDRDVLMSRLTKMVTKQIGLYYYHLPERHEKTSVLFSPILGLDDLDTVSIGFDAIDRDRMKQIVRSCRR